MCSNIGSPVFSILVLININCQREVFFSFSNQITVVLLTSMWPGSLSWVASMNMACAVEGLRTLPLKKLATGMPPYL